MAMILSIIVPVFNVKPYLDKCVNSLLCQDLDKSDYEIILVDDGSTDGGGEMCDSIAAREENVRVIHQANQGLSCARNTGMRQAKGKYLQFVDSDDYLVENVLGSLIRQMDRQNLEILRFRVQRVRERDDYSPSIQYSCLQDDEIMDGPFFLVHRLWFTCYACQFIFLRCFLENNSLFFKSGILFEDTEWTPRVMRLAHRVSNTDLLVYCYLIRGDSITGGAVQKRIAGQLSLIDDLKMQMQSFDDERWYKGMISHIVVSIITSVSLNLFNNRKQYLKALKSKDIYPLSTFLATKNGKRKILLINISPSLACYLIHTLNS